MKITEQETDILKMALKAIDVLACEDDGEGRGEGHRPAGEGRPLASRCPVKKPEQG